MDVHLLLDTSTSTTALILYTLNDGIILEHKCTSETLATTLDQSLKTLNLETSALKSIAVVEGPGSYTGLRIGIAFAKGLSYALGCPLIGVSRLKALVKHYEWNSPLNSTSIKRIVGLFLARAQEVYTIEYDALFQLKTPEHLAHLTDVFFKENASETLFISDLETLKEWFPEALVLKADYNATTLVKMAQDKYQAQEFESLFEFHPRYIKEVYIN